MPALYQAVLDAESTGALLDDIGQTQVLEVIARDPAARRASRQTLTLSAARALFEGGQVHALQIQYLFEDTHWCDTLMRTDGGVRVVRIAHES